MADTFQIQIATPERLLADEQVSWAELPGKEGYLGVLPDHAPLLSSLGPGIITYTAGGQERKLFVESGLLEVSDNHVRVLAEQAQPLDELDAGSARKQLEEAQQAADQPKEDQNPEELLAKLRIAEARVEAAERR